MATMSVNVHEEETDGTVTDTPTTASGCASYEDMRSMRNM